MIRMTTFVPGSGLGPVWKSYLSIGSRKCAPIADRTTLALYGSTVPGVSSTRFAPAPAALRRSVPRLPGSRI